MSNTVNKQDRFAALKAAFAKKSTGTSDTENSGYWDKFYPFFKMAKDEVALFRFLPDADEDNPLGFIVENRYHVLNVNGKEKKVACLSMFGKPCPCCEASQHYYNDVGDTALGKKFYRKVDYIGQGIVQNSPFEYPIKADENPVRLISIGPTLYKKLESSIVSGDFDVAPHDLLEGYDFRIVKSQKGEYASYDSSEFARRSTAIPDAMLERLDLYDLKKFRFTEISREQMEVMIEAVLTGKAVDDKQSHQQQESTGNPTLDRELATPKQTAPLDTVAATPTPTEAPSSDAKSRASDILARLRAKNAGNAS
jgi:hypothetical protein